jgi:2-polyprenyl-3-methyl-5-hydroxy-6-metoxy-1,4-benzoquinol methylase
MSFYAGNFPVGEGVYVRGRMSPVNGSLAPFYGLLTRRLQRARMRAIGPYLAPKARVLDVGCGLTDLPARLEDYVGCDRDPVVLGEMRRRYPSARFVAWDAAADEAPRELQETGPFDVVLLAAVLEHVSEPGRLLGRVASLLAPGGRVVTTTPHPIGRLPLEAGARLGLLSHAADEEHEDLLDRAGLAAAGRNAGLTLVTYERFLAGLNQTAVFARVEA